MPMIENLNAHDVLMAQLPDWFKPVLEYIALMEAYGVSLDGLQDLASAISDNAYIQTADEDTLKMWEKILGLPVMMGYSSEYRREQIIQRFMNFAPYTIWHLRDSLTELFGSDYTLTVNSERCELGIIIQSGRVGSIDLVYQLIHNVIPAHIYVNINQVVENYLNTRQYIGAILSRTFIQKIGG